MSVHARSALYYDALHRAQGKDYAAEATRLHSIVEKYGKSGGAWLDVACGTGRHIEHLRAWYKCEGLDVDRGMLNIAQERCPDVQFHCQDMIGFHLDTKFEAVTCLFSAIGYVPTAARLDQTVATMARHLKPGGVVIVEPWFRPHQWRDGYLDAKFADEPDLKVARMSVSRRDSNVSILNFNYMVAGNDGVRTFAEPHRLMLFTDDEYRRAFERAKLDVEYDEVGLTGRGLFIGTPATL
jgi:ubiquinone/menaquinone biosynthesis C-methylase UbiE